MTVKPISGNVNKELPRYWGKLCMLNLLIASFIGLLMRYKIVFPLPFADQTYLLHAHAHFVFCGWVSLTLFSCMVAYMLPGDVRKHPAYRLMFFLLEIASVGMLITFLYQGYGPLSIFFSFLFILIFYWFIILFWKDYKNAGVPREIQWFTRMGLVWFIVSSFGPYVLGYLSATHTGSPIETRAALYFYLHFQYNGWFTFAIFGLLLHWLHKVNFYPPPRKMRMVFLLLAIGAVPGYFLSVIGFYPYNWIEILSAFSVITHLAAAIILFIIIINGYKHISAVIPKETDILWKIATAAYFIKTAMQAAILIPALAAFAFSFRPLIIGYLHLVFLCFVSFFLIGFLLDHHQISSRRAVTPKLGLTLFIVFVLLNELTLFGQSFCAYISQYFGFFPIVLLWITAGIFLGLLLFVIGQKHSLKNHLP
jgi:hypothetical protein